MNHVKMSGGFNVVFAVTRIKKVFFPLSIFSLVSCNDNMLSSFFFLLGALTHAQRQRFPLTCFPFFSLDGSTGPPELFNLNQIGATPAASPGGTCLLPADNGPDDPLPDAFKSSGYTGHAILGPYDPNRGPDGKQRIQISLDGVKSGQVITAWYAYYLPPQGPPSGFPHLESRVAGPLASRYGATFNGGLSLGADNDFVDNGDDTYNLNVEIDYDLFDVATGGPMVSSRSHTSQQNVDPNLAGYPYMRANKLAPLPGFIPPPAFNSTVPVDGGYLRDYDPDTGYMKLDDQGRQILVNSQHPVRFIAIVTHTDMATHGFVPGMPTLPVRGRGGGGGCPPTHTGSMIMLIFFFVFLKIIYLFFGCWGGIPPL